MKHLKISLPLLGLSLIIFPAHSQNWDIIRTDLVYNYTYSGSETDTIVSVWTDSVQTAFSDTLLFMNRKVELSEDYELIANRPHFLQRFVLKTDSTVFFNDTGAFVIKRKLIPRDSWLFDTIHNITATCISNTSGQTFGQADSIAQISITGNKTIVISKRFGLLSFDNPFSNENYTLIGIDNEGLGFCLPKFADFFSFGVGDRFVYSESAGDPGGSCESLYRYTIMNIISQTDTMKYRVRKDYWTYWEIWKSDQSSGSDTLIINYNKADFPVGDMYNNQLISDYCFHGIFYPPCSPYYGFTKVWQDADTYATKSIGFDPIDNLTPYLFCGNLSESDTLVNSEDSYTQILKEGLGIYYESLFNFEDSYDKYLLAWETSHGSHGNIDTLEDWLHYLDLKKSEKQPLLIYPNPSNGHIVFKLIAKEYPLFSIYDLTGKLLLTGTLNRNDDRLDLSFLGAGVYILEVFGNSDCIRKKLIIKK